MKILWLSHLVPYPPKGGVLQRSYNMLKEAAKGNVIDLASLVQPRLVKSMYPDLETGLSDATNNLGRLCRRVTFVDIPAESTSISRYRAVLSSLTKRSSYSNQWLWNPQFAKLVNRWLADEQYDLVHIDTLGLCQYYGADVTVPATLNHHNIESHMMRRRAEKETNLLKKAFEIREWRRLYEEEHGVLTRVHTHLVCSTLDAQRLFEIDDSCKVEVIPNGVDIEYFSPGSEDEGQQRSLIFVGGLNWYPNRSAMLWFTRKVWPSLRAQCSSVRLDIVGAEPPRELLELAEKDERVKVHGFVDDVRPLIARASIYVCPIFDGGGTKLKVLDAFAMGKAVVAHPVACEGIDVTPGENVLFAQDAAEFESTVMTLLAAPEERGRLGAAARALVERQYSYSAIGGELRSVFEETARGG